MPPAVGGSRKYLKTEGQHFLVQDIAPRRTLLFPQSSVEVDSCMVKETSTVAYLA